MISNNNNFPNSNSPVDSIDMLSISRNIDEFKSLDLDNKGYLDENQARSYFKTQCSSQENCDSIISAAFDQTSQLRLEKFLIVTHLLRLDIRNDNDLVNDNDENASSSRFSSLLRHCEESLQQVEKDRKNSSTSLPASKVKLSAAIVQLESCWKALLRSNAGSTFNKYENDTDIRSQRVNSADDKEDGTHTDNPNNTYAVSTAPRQSITNNSTLEEEVMPGSFGFDKTEENENHNWNSASNAALMALPPVAPPRKSDFLSINSEGKIVTSPNDVNNDVSSLGEKDPGFSQSYATPTSQSKDTANERSMFNDAIAPNKAFEETLPSTPFQAATMNPIDSAGIDLSPDRARDIKKETEVLEDDNEGTDINEPSSSIAKGVIIPSVPTTVVPSRAVEDPIVESTDGDATFAQSVPQHPMVQAELFSHPSFYSCSSYRSIDDNKSNEVPASPLENESTNKRIIDHKDFPSGLDTDNPVEDTPQLTVPVTKSPILSDAQFSSLTGFNKPEVDKMQEANTTLPSTAEKNSISVLPLLASPAIGSVFLNKDGKDQDTSLNNADNLSDVSGAISPPPSFNSEVKSNIANNSSLDAIHRGLDDTTKDVGRSAVKEPLYQSADSKNIDSKLQHLDPSSPQNNDLLSTHGSLMADNKRHSIVSVESRFIELDDDNVSPLIKNATHFNDLDVPVKIKGPNTTDNKTDIKKAPDVPQHNAVDLPPSPSSISSGPHSKANKRVSYGEDKTLASAIKDTYEFLATPSKTKEGGRVLKVRNGFAGFCGLGIECVHDDINFMSTNDDDEIEEVLASDPLLQPEEQQRD
ncbi:unnamed protein product [Mucor hiemalis]